ncbi:putative ferredoxin [Besnoitia besnoiti]|uniref:Putative ferredoxin n=1 Tax=Besnoitia besnoiti TaxID=94643 RepID=A0A2A9MNH1_BESBE|nr:putative ferredoxin [Besnoitia besnoiti]PFH37240.1 putative ferredoxin [Besnoitia besnoiti]
MRARRLSRCVRGILGVAQRHASPSSPSFSSPFAVANARPFSSSSSAFFAVLSVPLKQEGACALRLFASWTSSSSSCARHSCLSASSVSRAPAGVRPLSSSLPSEVPPLPSSILQPRLLFSAAPQSEPSVCGKRGFLWFGKKDGEEGTPRAAAETTSESASEGATQSASGAQAAGGAPTVTFVSADEQTKLPCTYRPGQTLLMVALENEVGIEGACGGQCACSTCHVILNEKDFSKFPEPDDDEQDMLDLAVHTTNTSRLGCQLKLTEDHSGLEVRLPAATVNQMYR